LLGDDAAKAYRAIWTLSASPERAVRLLTERLKPVESDDPDADLTLGPLARGEALRRLWSIAVLGKIRTPQRLILGRLASGLDGACETRAAKAALRRLK
jgi:hypothetical protein